MNPAASTLATDLNAQQSAYAYIKEEILALRLRPGARLNANELATRIGISRTPVREALGRLEHEGLVRRESAGGFRVHAMSLKEIVDVYRVREALEVEAALEALPHLTPQLLEEMAAALAEGESLLDPRDYAEAILANRRFHALIVRASGNAMLESMMTPIADPRGAAHRRCRAGRSRRPQPRAPRERARLEPAGARPRPAFHRAAALTFGAPPQQARRSSMSSNPIAKSPTVQPIAFTGRSGEEWRRKPPLPDSHVVSTKVYTDPDIFDEEVEKIWSKVWLPVCHESELPEPLDYRTTGLAGNKPPVRHA